MSIQFEQGKDEAKMCIKYGDTTFTLNTRHNKALHSMVNLFHTTFAADDIINMVHQNTLRVSPETGIDCWLQLEQ